MIVYGWEEISKEKANLLRLEVAGDDFFKVKNKKTTELFPKRAIDQAYNKGRWFLDLGEAKKAMIDELSHEIDWRVEIVSKVRDVTLKNFE